MIFWGEKRNSQRFFNLCFCFKDSFGFSPTLATQPPPTSSSFRTAAREPWLAAQAKEVFCAWSILGCVFFVFFVFSVFCVFFVFWFFVFFLVFFVIFVFVVFLGFFDDF